MHPKNRQKKPQNKKKKKKSCFPRLRRHCMHRRPKIIFTSAEHSLLCEGLDMGKISGLSVPSASAWKIEQQTEARKNRSSSLELHSRFWAQTASSPKKQLPDNEFFNPRYCITMFTLFMGPKMSLSQVVFAIVVVKGIIRPWADWFGCWWIPDPLAARSLS